MGSINPITLEAMSPDDQSLQAQLDEALIRELVLKARNGAAGLLGASVLLWMILRAWTGGTVAALFVVLVSVTAIRGAGGRWLGRERLQRLPVMRVFGWLLTVCALTGACLGAIVVASYPHLPITSTLMLIVIMIAINSAAMVSLAASPTAYACYAGPALLAWAIVAFAYPLPGFERVFEVAIVIYGVVIALTIRAIHHSLRNNIVLRLRLAASLGELRDTQSKLVEASRLAGRSDVATAVLHSVGNVLNSVNVSAGLVNEIVINSRVSGLTKIATTLNEHRGDLARYLDDDDRGQKLPPYLLQLGEVLEMDKAAATAELQSLIRHIDQIKIIVASQQSHVKRGGLSETFEVHQLLDDAIKLSAASWDRDAIEIVRSFDPLPPATLDRHKALQILMNLLANAHDAVMTNDAAARRITLGARQSAKAEAEITVADNGGGIDAPDLDRIFHLGFTTKPERHGLGLHYCACAAHEMNGELRARSAGPGRGATFVLRLPLGAAPTT